MREIKIPFRYGLAPDISDWVSVPCRRNLGISQPELARHRRPRKPHRRCRTSHNRIKYPFKDKSTCASHSSQPHPRFVPRKTNEEVRLTHNFSAKFQIVVPCTAPFEAMILPSKKYYLSDPEDEGLLSVSGSVIR